MVSGVEVNRNVYIVAGGCVEKLKLGGFAASCNRFSYSGIAGPTLALPLGGSEKVRRAKRRDSP